MIKEAYVSFEVAKLLKEKGFNEYCLKNYWSSDKELHDWKWELSYNRNSDGNSNTKDCSAPTQAMAVAWLREKYGISIEISALNQYQWVYAIYRLLKDSVAEVWNDGTYVSHEDATDDALKYCLENLNKLT